MMNHNNLIYTVEENLLNIGDKALPFKYKINNIIEVPDMLIVFLESPRDTVFNENVFGVSLAERDVKWQITKLRYDTGVDCPFVGGRFYNGQLYLHNWCDIYLIVDPLTGEILERSLPAKS
jgi:hypothetical protein